MMPFSVNQRRKAVVIVHGPLQRSCPVDVMIEMIQEKATDIDPAEDLHLHAEIVSARDLSQMSLKRGTEKEGLRMTITLAVTETASCAPRLPILTTPEVVSTESIVTSVLTGTTEVTHHTSPHLRAQEDL